MLITLFYIPFPTNSEATSLGLKTIENRLAACSNVFPIQSIFPWDGVIQHEDEFILILKTIPSLENQLRSFISEYHSYDVPCIASWNVEVNDKYGEWVKENVRQF